MTRWNQRDASLHALHPVRQSLETSRASDAVERTTLLCIAWWLLITSAWGFGGVAPYLRPFPQHAAVIQLHAIGFALWTVLVVVQTHLALARRTKAHRVCGVVSLGALTLAIVTGIMTIVRSVALDRRTFGEGLLLLAPLLVGGALVTSAFLVRRRDPCSHGQTMLLATALFTTLAVDRIGFLLGLHATPWLVASIRLIPVMAIAALEIRRGRLSWGVPIAGSTLIALDLQALLPAG